MRKSGIRIGQVTHVDFADDDRSVLVTAKIDRGRSVYHDEICRVNSSLLVGDTALEFVRSGDPDLPKTPLESYETINGKVVQDPTRAVANLQEGLTKTMGNVQGASDEMVTVLRRVNKLLETNDDRITSVIQQADKTLQEFRRATENANTVLGDANVREDFKQTLAQMPEVLKETRDTVGAWVGRSAWSRRTCATWTALPGRWASGAKRSPAASSRAPRNSTASWTRCSSSART